MQSNLYGVLKTSALIISRTISSPLFSEYRETIGSSLDKNSAIPSLTEYAPVLQKTRISPMEREENSASLAITSAVVQSEPHNVHFSFSSSVE